MNVFATIFFNTQLSEKSRQYVVRISFDSKEDAQAYGKANGLKLVSTQLMHVSAATQEGFKHVELV